MSFPQTDAPTTAIVLGGGGAVGVSWQTGLLTGLREAGVDLAKAEATVGTSAGAFVGALLSSGREVSEALVSLSRLGQVIDPVSMAAGDEAFLGALRQESRTADPRQAQRAIGRVANEAPTISEDEYLGLFDTLKGAAWPTGFRCTATDTETGDRVVWDESSEVELLRAVAASCSIPCLFPTVSIRGDRFTDGGILSHVNAAAAPLTDVLVVLSVHSLALKSDRGGGSLFASVSPEEELAPLRETRQIIAVEPDFREIETQANMMDPNIARQALQIGKRQAATTAAALQAAWNPAVGPQGSPE
jgi:NTE family protein